MTVMGRALARLVTEPGLSAGFDWIDWCLLTLWAHTRTGALGRQSRRRTKPRLAVLARTATPSGAPGRPFPSGCCRKRRSRRCKVSPGALPAFAFAPCARRFRRRNAFVSIALAGPGCLDSNLRHGGDFRREIVFLFLDALAHDEQRKAMDCRGVCLE